MSEKTFRAIFRSSGPVHLRRRDFVGLRDIGTSQGTATAEIFTSYEDLGIGAPVPRELTVVIEGSHKDLDAAHREFHLMAIAMSNLVAIAANCGIGKLESHILLETTPGAEDREGVIFYRPTPRYDGYIHRLADVEELGAVLTRFPSCVEQKRFSLAASLYQLALDHWADGSQPVPLSFLFMGAEALTNALVRHRCKELGVDKQELAKSIGIDTSKDRWESQFRRVLVFKGDDEVHRLAKKTSDGIEHGFGDMGQIRDDSRAVILQLFRYVREALLTVLGVPEPWRERLAKREPLDYMTARRLLYFRFGGGNEALADRRWHPTVHWEPQETEASEQADGFVDIRLRDGIQSADLGDMKIRLLRPEFRDLQSKGSGLLEVEVDDLGESSDE